MTDAKLSSSKAVQYLSWSIWGQYSLKRGKISMFVDFETSWRLKTCASINSEMWWRHAKCRSFFFILLHSAPFTPVFKAAVSKQRPAILSHNSQSSMVWEISFAIVTAVLSWSFGIDNSFTTFCPETIMGRRSNRSVPGPMHFPWTYHPSVILAV